MISSIVNYRKTKRGSIIKIVREHYVRNDIVCGLKQCHICYGFLNLHPALKSVVEDSICLESNCRNQISSLVTGSHLVIVDDECLLKQMDIIEDDQFGSNTVLLQTVMNRVRNKSLNIYSRVKQMMSASPHRNFFIFINDHHQQTYSARNPGESIEDYHHRMIIQACAWYLEHWSKFISAVVLLSCKEETKQEYLKIANIINGPKSLLVFTLREYVQALKKNNEIVDKLSIDDEQTNLNDNNKEDKFIYNKHYTIEETRSGLKSGKLYQGKFQASRDNSLEGFVSITLNDEDVQVLIQGRESLNRAVQDDIVAIQLLPKSEWKTKSNLVILPDASGENDVVDEADQNDEDTLLNSKSKASVHDETSKKPTAKVVSIIKRKWRQYCGTLRLKDIGSSSTMTRYLFVPNERRIPVIRIETRQYDILKNQRLVVAIDSWPRDSKYPLGHYVRALGTIGDKETENQVLLLEHDVPHSMFSRAVLDCLPPEGNDWTIPEEEFSKRADLRNLSICSVDPPGCTDIDDALHCVDLNDGTVEVGVHIADVSYYVKPMSALDQEAANRGTTVYLADRRIDMIPGLLSSNLCSLIEKRDRLAFSVIWKLDKKTCTIRDTKFMRSIICSKASLTYEEAQLKIDEKNQTSDIHKGLRSLNDLAKKLKRKRMESGALVLARADEIRFVEIDSETHENDASLEIQHKRLMETNSMVEEFMLLANISVAQKLLEDFPELALLRRHPKPSTANFDELVEAAKSQGFKIEADDGKHLSESLDKAKLPNNEFFNLMLRMIATRCMTPAAYFCSGCGEKSKSSFSHFGLAADIYTHFTSPIRRYADLLVHRLLAHSIGSSHLDKSMLNKNTVQALCDQINYRHRMAQFASRASTKLHTVLYIKSKKILQNEDAYVFYVRQNALQILIPRIAFEHTYFLNPAKDWQFEPDTREQIYLPGKISIHQFDKIKVDISLASSDSDEAKTSRFSERITVKIVVPPVDIDISDAPQTIKKAENSGAKRKKAKS